MEGGGEKECPLVKVVTADFTLESTKYYAFHANPKQ